MSLHVVRVSRSRKRRLRTPEVAASGWWEAGGAACCWAAYQPKGAASFAASLTDLSGNGHDAVNPGGANTPGWDVVSGWTFDGMQQYLTTTFVPQNDQSQSMIVRFSDVPDDGEPYWISGMREDEEVDSLFMIALEDGGLYYGNGSFEAGTEALAGVCAVAGNQGYLNGVADGNVIGAWGMVPTISTYIGAVNFEDVPIFHLQGYIQAFALYDCTLTADQVLAVRNAMSAL